jgi:Ser-tRNA(Ala) deacylase AlaX
VENVQRRGLVAVHHVRVPPELVDKAEDVLGPGKTVEMVVDWERRFDHVRATPSRIVAFARLLKKKTSFSEPHRFPPLAR